MMVVWAALPSHFKGASHLRQPQCSRLGDSMLPPRRHGKPETLFGSTFYPRDAMLARVFATATCPSVRTSVCHTPALCLAERKQDRATYTI